MCALFPPLITVDLYYIYFLLPLTHHHHPPSLWLPKVAIRLTVTITGNKVNDTLPKIKDLKPCIIFIRTNNDLSNLHASRRVFDHSNSNGIDLSVIHTLVINTDDTNDLALTMGSSLWSLLVDGDSNGVMVELTTGYSGSSEKISLSLPSPPLCRIWHTLSSATICGKIRRRWRRRRRQAALHKLVRECKPDNARSALTRNNDVRTTSPPPPSLITRHSRF